MSLIGSRFVPKSVTVNDFELRNGLYFALFHRICLCKTIIRPLCFKIYF